MAPAHFRRPRFGSEPRGACADVCARAPGARQARWSPLGALGALGVVAALALGCETPQLAKDGQLVFPERGGSRGASVLTANGIEFMDRNELPRPTLRRSAYEPWQPPTGFLLPADGIWRETSTPVAIDGNGLAVVLRASDALVPAWGGEVLLRIDTIVPLAAFPDAKGSARPPKRLAIVLDGHGPNVAPLAEVAIDDLGERDRATVVDAAGARTIVPLVPGTHRSLLEAAVRRIVATPDRGRDLSRALGLARNWLDRASPGPEGAPASERQILLLTDAAALDSAAVHRVVAELGAAHVRLSAIGAPDELTRDALASLGNDVHAGGPFADREDAVAHAVPPPGAIVLRDVTLTIGSAPAPTHVLEVSGGLAGMSLEEDRIELGDLYVGEARTEVARLATPQWLAHERLRLFVTARYRDAATGQPLVASKSIDCRYSEDVEEIATSRHGDVIAYASALAMVRRLDRAFAGSRVDRVGGLRSLVAWQARSLSALAREQHDAALGTQAELLTTLLSALPN